MNQFHVFARAGLLLALVLVPACGNKHESGSAPPAVGGSGGSDGALFSEDFSGTFPGTAWNTPSGSAGSTVEIAAGTGNPAPSLSITTTSGPGFAQAQCNTVIMKAPFSISTDMAVQTAGEGSGALDLLNSAQQPIAVVEWHPPQVGGAVTFMIADPAAPGNPHLTSVVPPAAGPTFHTFKFSVDASGNATWTMDGGTPVLSATGFPTSGPFVIRLYDNIQSTTGPFAKFFFDNVKITAP